MYVRVERTELCLPFRSKVETALGTALHCTSQALDHSVVHDVRIAGHDFSCGIVLFSPMDEPQVLKGYSVAESEVDGGGCCENKEERVVSWTRRVRRAEPHAASGLPPNLHQPSPHFPRSLIHSRSRSIITLRGLRTDTTELVSACFALRVLIPHDLNDARECCYTLCATRLTLFCCVEVSSSVFALEDAHWTCLT